MVLYHESGILTTPLQIHGLGGSSIKTWCNSGDLASFWPREWLPLEKGFKHVRIHSYGYDVNWSKSQQGILGIADFGRGLLEDMMNSPDLRKPGDVSILDSLFHRPTKAVIRLRLLWSHTVWGV